MKIGQLKICLNIRAFD